MNKLSIILSALACCLSLSGCIESAIKENMMEQASGKYILTSFKCDGADMNLSRMIPGEVLNADIYPADGKWFFDCVLPDTDYHGGFEYKKLVVPLRWNSALGRLVFDYDGIMDEDVEVSDASLEGGVVTISTIQINDLYVNGRINQKRHNVTCKWERKAR